MQRLELDLSTLGNNDEPTSESNSKITECMVVASYNWLERESPTILVPGVPPVWYPPPGPPPKLYHDTGKEFVDENADRNPRSSIEPLLSAILTVDATFDFTKIDLIADRRVLATILALFHDNNPGGRKRFEPFTLSVQVIGRTVILSHYDIATRRSSGHHMHYRYAFEREYTMLRPEAQRSASHYRVLRYRLGGLWLLVRYGIEAFVSDTYDEKEDNKGDASNDTNDMVTGLVPHRKPEALQRPSPKVDDPLIAAGVTVVEGGVTVRQDQVIEIKTRWFHSDAATAMTTIRAPKLWLGQVEQLVVGSYVSLDVNLNERAHELLNHNKDDIYDIRAAFLSPCIRHVRENINTWQSQNAADIRLFTQFLNALVKAVRAASEGDESKGQFLLRYDNSDKVKIKSAAPHDPTSPVPDEFTILFQ